ncbi:MAG: antibiotic biosynthesis monooxygenase family protein [Paracoccus sp. (in: a-proteobacteria)]|uniref:antibiotic biosynthesis monooxygenase family protein n=1 Tax=Paracoccus sp. TaxID=267 RepID=UPI0026DF3530|nr:antibiotic biosynthesis monooxygenase family protein [Paracoccus sp. (in: a-proteobacteria)]MDO5633057.1 antibiotic biosynthesis monooxygenase family protein [Paracoccus sp. (in: a-proteobacteria)]
MIREIAALTIAPETTVAFEAAMAKARPIFLAAKGCHAMRLDRVIETPGQYRLVVEWDSLAHHTEIFRNAPGFQEWRALAGPFFVAPPVVVHTETVVG